MTLPNPAMSEVSLGIDAEAFVLSPLGKYLVACSEREVEDAVEKLKRVDPRDVHKVATLLHAIRVAEAVPRWLAEAIQAGHNAEQQMVMEKAEDAG